MARSPNLASNGSATATAANLKNGRNVELVSRQGRSLANAFPEVIAALAKLRADVVLDCELVNADLPQPGRHPT